MREPQLSIIVVNFETPDYTQQCLQSIYQNPPSCPFEVLVVDNGSGDGSAALIRSSFPEARCIEAGQNLGFARANNLGIELSRGEMVLLLNSDTKILDNSLDGLIRHLEQRPDVGAVGPRQLDGHGRLQLSWGHFPTLITEMFRKILHHRLSLNDLRIRDYLEEKYAESADVDWVSGSCLMARKTALRQAGFLDGRFFMYFEDIDLCRRVRDAGWKIQFLSQPTLIHYGGVSAKKNLARVLVEYRRSQIHFTRKYYGRAGELVLKLLLFGKYSAHLFHWAGAYAASRIRRAESRTNLLRLLVCRQTLLLLLPGRIPGSPKPPDADLSSLQNGMAA